MNVRLRALVATLSLAGAMSSSQAATAQPAAADAAGRADNLARQALELAKAHKYVEAEVLLREAWSLKHSYDIAGNLGVCELNLGRFRQAAEHLAFAKKTFPAIGHQDLETLLATSIAKAKAEIGTLTVAASPSGAHVFVDGADVGAAPLDEPVYVDPGAHTIEARLGAGSSGSQSVSLSKGQAETVTLLVIEGAKVVPGTPGTPVIPEAVSTRSKVPAIVLGAAGVVGLGLGATFTLIAGSKESDADKFSRETGHACPVSSGGPALCGQLRSATSSADTFSNAGTAALITGGALVAGGIGYWFWASASPSQAPASAVRVLPLMGPTLGGAVFSGSF